MMKVTMNISTYDYDFFGDDGITGLTASEATLLTLYGIVLLVGVIANGGLAMTVCGQKGMKSSRKSGVFGRFWSRSPILLALCAADLMVCSLSAPLSVCFALLATNPWPLEVGWCKFAFFLQALPVTVSAFSLALVSVDRYLTVKCPRRIERLHHRFFMQCYTIAAMGAWLVGFLATCPVIAVRRIPPWSDGRCVEVYSSKEWRGVYIIGRLVVEHIVPSIIVVACHLGVKRKLTSLSLSGRAANGDLPLPVPLLKAPANVIIVSGLTNNGDGKVITYKPNDADVEAGNLVDRVRSCNYTGSSSSRRKPSLGPLNRKRKRPTPYVRPASRTEQEIREENRRLRPQQNAPLPNASRPSNTLKSRRRLANALLSASALFIGCWLPHVVCTLCAELCGLPSSQLTVLSQYCLLLGHAHSAINPIIYWTLNHKSLRSSCDWFALFRVPLGYKNASSTNEAALGPFHPRYARPANVNNDRRNSSSYLY